ncbi:DUF441 domain-containing protein [Alkalihalobacillus sp. BA299]|uniref:DUF441 domain-containing protein n=1 Tax=Alkalihalobacillus sp. BA299 TaxID=2815938 RepID=UPI001ADCE516|nr:DUF441 domain-containing protein [Alkalihalobacillus sp. BA299]
MLSQSSLFLLILLVISWLGKNQSLLVAVVALLLLKWTGLGDKLFPLIQAKGINWGVTILTIAVLVPIATGEIGFKQLTDSLKSSYAWIALFSGIAVAIIAASGVDLLKNDPHITTALVLGTIMAVVLFKGIAVGPLIAAGIAYLIIQIISFFTANGS